MTAQDHPLPSLSGRTPSEPDERPRVLVLSDQPAAERQWSRLLCGQDCEFMYAADLNSARRLLQCAPVEALVVDLTLADEKDVIVAIRELRQQQPETQSILITNAEASDIAALSEREGVFGYLHRPVDPMALTSLVAAAIHSRHEAIEHSRHIAKIEVEKQRLKELNRRLQDALAFTGHEWRNQLTRLSLDVQKLTRETGGVLGSEQATTVERISQNAAVMRRAAHNYLDLARVDAPEFVLRPSFVNPVRDIIKPLQSSYTDLLARNNQTCQVKAVEPDLLVWADHALLMSVYDNLISNAIKYGEPGGQIVLNLDDRGIEDELGVWNSGPGLGPWQLERLFERFTIAAKAGAGESTGIGLYLVQKIVEAHGGRIWADSRPGAGVRMTFTLPKYRAKNGDDPA